MNRKYKLARLRGSQSTKSAIVYIRTSLDEKGKQVNSPEAQRRDCERWAHLNDFDIKMIVEERVKGDTVPSKRKGFSKVLDALECGDIILVQRNDRIARKAHLSLEAGEDVVNLGCDIVSVDRGNYKGNELLYAVDASQAQSEKRNIIVRTKRSARVRKLDGKVYGEIVFGMMRQGEDDQVINEDEAKIKDFVISLRKDGMKYKDIVTECASLGFCDRAGNVPSTQTLWRWCSEVRTMRYVLEMENQGMSIGEIVDHCEKINTPEVNDDGFRIYDRWSKSPSLELVALWCKEGLTESKKLSVAKRKAKRTLGEVSPLLKHEVLRLRALGLSYRKIASALNEIGVTNSAGGEIVHTQVARIIKRSENEG